MKILAILLMMIAPALAADRIALSRSFEFYGVCTGGDMWDKWKVHGSPEPPDAFVRPFEEEAITVIGYELAELRHVDAGWSKSSGTWYMVGSSIWADAQVMIAPGETHSRTMWPPGVSQPWPSVKEARQNQFLDLHGYCPKGDSVSVLLTIYYTKP